MKQPKSNPALRGVIDTFLGVELIYRSTIPDRNRLAVILIDSAFETACRAFLQYKARITLSDAHKHRDNLIKTVKSKLTAIDEEVWQNIDYYYTEIRCDFYHQSAGKTITDVPLLDYRDNVQFVIDTAFGISISDLVAAQFAALQTNASPSPDKGDTTLYLHLIPDRVDKVLIAVARCNPKTVEDVNQYFHQAGEGLRLDTNEFLNVVARNSGSKKLFYHSKESKSWVLSALGRFRLDQLQKEQHNAD